MRDVFTLWRRLSLAGRIPRLIHLSVMLINTAFSHYYPPNPSKGWFRWVNAKRRNPIANALDYFFLHYVIHIRSVICGLVQIESTLLGLSISWYKVTSITSNTYIDYWSQAVQSLNVDSSLDMSLILCYSSMLCSDYLKMVGMDRYATLKM